MKFQTALVISDLDTDKSAVFFPFSGGHIRKDKKQKRLYADKMDTSFLGDSMVAYAKKKQDMMTGKRKNDG